MMSTIACKIRKRHNSSSILNLMKTCHLRQGILSCSNIKVVQTYIAEKKLRKFHYHQVLYYTEPHLSSLLFSTTTESQAFILNTNYREGIKKDKIGAATKTDNVPWLKMDKNLLPSKTWGIHQRNFISMHQELEYFIPFLNCIFISQTVCAVFELIHFGC